MNEVLPHGSRWLVEGERLPDPKARHAPLPDDRRVIRDRRGDHRGDAPDRRLAGYRRGPIKVRACAGDRARVIPREPQDLPVVRVDRNGGGLNVTQAKLRDRLVDRGWS